MSGLEDVDEVRAMQACPGNIVIVSNCGEYSFLLNWSVGGTVSSQIQQPVDQLQAMKKYQFDPIQY
jgi:hypothetical protein